MFDGVRIGEDAKALDLELETTSLTPSSTRWEVLPEHLIPSASPFSAAIWTAAGGNEGARREWRGRRGRTYVNTDFAHPCPGRLGSATASEAECEYIHCALVVQGAQGSSIDMFNNDVGKESAQNS